MSDRLVCVHCHQEIIGPRTIGNGLRRDGSRVCGFCATSEEERRRLKELLAQGDQ